jgi:hypothetical protein
MYIPFFDTVSTEKDASVFQLWLLLIRSRSYNDLVLVCTVNGDMIIRGMVKLKPLMAEE